MAKAILEKATHEYTADNGSRVALSVSQVLSLSGIVQPYPESAAFNVARAGELGTTVHEWCDWLDSDADDMATLDAINNSPVLPYVTAYQRFREKHKPVWTAIEESCWDEELGVAGTPDRIGMIEVGGISVPAIVDIKTPKTVSASWQIQLSAYSVISGRLEHNLFVVLLASDASFRLIHHQAEHDTFRAAVRVAQWRVANGAKKK